MSVYKTEKFKKLQTEWYRKLEKSGFEDIETHQNGKDFLKVWHSAYFQTKYSPASFEFKREYYRAAALFLQRHVFETEREKKIWERHSEGWSLRRIAREFRTKVCRVHKIVRILVKIMAETHDGQ